MNISRHTLAHILVLAFALTSVGCFKSDGTDPDECEPTKLCRVADALGCCGEGVEVSVCAMCPAGTIEETSCRAAEACVMCDESFLCVEDLGEGCCGRQATRCTPDCPAGMTLVTAGYCDAYYPSCGCGPEFTGGAPGARPAPEPDPAPPGPPVQDAGMPDGAGHSDASAFDAGQPECVEDFGDGCCGRFVAYESECGCPVGSRVATSCSDFGGAGIVAPSETCYADLGGGCCGGVVEANQCSGACPTGSLPESACGARVDGEVPVEFDPIPAAPCYELLSEGCCGAAVAVDVCGQCPVGATMECAAFLPECS